jgi:hypothetical protein
MCVCVFVCIYGEIRLAFKSCKKERLMKLYDTTAVTILINWCEVWNLIKHEGRNKAAGKQLLRLLSAYPLQNNQ